MLHHRPNARRRAEADGGASLGPVEEEVEDVLHLLFADVGDAEHGGAEALNVVGLETAQHIGRFLIAEEHEQDGGRLAALGPHGLGAHGFVHGIGLSHFWPPYLHRRGSRSEEHTSELQSLMRISYAVFCLKKKKKKKIIILTCKTAITT